MLPVWVSMTLARAKEAYELGLARSRALNRMNREL